MNTDIKGENGHCGHEMYITFSDRTSQIMVIFKDFVRHAVDRLDKATRRAPRRCDQHHKEIWQIGLTFGYLYVIVLLYKLTKVVKRKVVKMITLTDITPVADWSIPCNDTDYCDGYGCEIHSSYQGGMCGVTDCVSPVSSYRVIVEGVEMDMCHFHYNS